MSLLYIEDGLTLSAEVAPGLHAVYRPALPERVERYLRERARAAEKAPLKPLVELALECLVSWTLQDRTGAAVACGEPALRRLRYPVLVALVDRLAGYSLDGESEADQGN